MIPPESNPIRSGYHRSSSDWSDYFDWNRDNPMAVPWDEDYRMTEREVRAVGRSMGIFQLGESSDGASFIAAGERYAAQSGDRDYPEALRLFIGEENGHARLLARIMEAQGIPRLEHQWTDGLFRWLRKRAGLDVAISVLVTAELLAKVYYRALRDATGSAALKAVCTQILRDEVEHIYFQCGTIGRMRRGRSIWRIAGAEILQRILMMGALVVVWMDHRRVFRIARMSFRAYARDAWRELLDGLRIVRTCAVLEEEREITIAARVEQMRGVV